ncbi:uncharacterized protein LOC8284804 isoform X2 [Ricinus communis]|uniref:uncharacterized protein LOC8284804 isoform X2 n=1 Tax=Ricinus communis TaxID=3988 RepID=UPI000772C0D6|nr:uncharacterized protein LOC8284804 isoform X2 [Ricinus communis]|eukprot:XP_015571680.1 uncharacterized protein LOC8284804 isoform X2 [Ricinus communis]
MAQAARLNLRMQKELKLLLSDPPPEIKGPEGTVYAEGIFTIKIQIPERYPFQPPGVTFATPIYHPNIDNGGRICLDILNLPPKGAWQPSLNISTVLTSIGLLLSEPNPDDGLMCEASREYKYNRQAFDQKARAMTVKHAEAGVTEHSCRTQSVQIDLDISTEVEAKQSGIESKHEVNHFVSTDDRPCRISRKLSLEPSSSTPKRASDGEANGTTNLLKLGSENMRAEIERSELRDIPGKCNLGLEKLCRSGTMRNSTLEFSVRFDKRDGHNNENGDPKHWHSLSNGQSLPMATLGSLVLQGGSRDALQHENRNGKSTEYSKITSSEKPCQVRLFSGSLDACQTSDGKNDYVLVTPAVQPSQSHSNSLPGALTMPLSINHDESKTFQDSVHKVGKNACVDAERKKAFSICRKLSLSSKAMSERRGREGKENVLPTHNLRFSSQTLERKTKIGQELSLGPLTQLQGCSGDISQLLLHSREFPNESQRQRPNQHRDGKLAWGIREREEESPVVESVIVLDSEDSEEENNGLIRSKLPLVRRRIGKRKTQA